MEANIAVIRRFYEEILNQRNLDAADKFLDAGFREYGTMSHNAPGLSGFKLSLTNLLTAFPDLRVTIEDELAVGDKVVVRWTDHGTHQGEFLGIGPTGKQVLTTGISIFRLSKGKIVEQWTNWDTLSLLGQLGIRDRLPQDLVGRMLASQEEERRRMAYEVHDGLAQTAVAAHGLLEAYAANHPVAHPEEQENLRKVLNLIQQIVVESRRVIAALRPMALDDFGLAAALRLHVEALAREGWSVSFDEEIGDGRLPAVVETTLFRVAQEALTNARKHAGPAKIRVKLWRSDREVRLRLRDYGQGFQVAGVYPSSNAGERVGLYGMRERVALLGGETRICSEPSIGTLVVAKIPLVSPRE